MGLKALPLILSATMAISGASSPEPQQPGQALIARLRSLDLVGGRACGAMPSPTEFFKLSQVMIASGTQEQCEELLRDDHAVVRCMGLVVLAQMGGRKHAWMVRSCLKDRGLIRYMTTGCFLSTTTVGAFAADLLFTNGTVLGHSGPLLPLISEEEQVGLCLEILAADSAVITHPRASARLQRDVRSGKATLELIRLRESAPALQDFEIIKAVGRLPRSIPQRDFLIACLDANSPDNKSRLAAASALTRHTDRVAVQALLGNREALNRLGKRLWGDEFIETSNAMKVHEKNTWVFRGFHPFARRSKKVVIAALTSNHPLALSTLYKHTPAGYGPDNRDIRQAWAGSMVAISKRIGDFTQPWNTYASEVFHLDCIVQSVRFFQHKSASADPGFVRDENWLTVEEYREFEKNVTEALSAALSQE